VYLNRTIPQVEVDAVSKFLFHLLTGDVDKLPTQTLVHKFWTVFSYDHKQSAKYLSCLRDWRLSAEKCYQDIGNYCGNRFGNKPLERIQRCRQLLTNEINVTTAGLEPTIAKIFDNYRSCFQSYRHRVDANCTNVLRKLIANHRLRAAKVVRATMDSMRPLLLSLPTLRVIHLVRDPRAVALSRIRFGDSGRGLYSLQSRKLKSTIVAEASLYCRHVTADIRSRLALEREFPGRILTVRYEDVVANPEQHFRDVYRLLDEQTPNATLDEMRVKAQDGKNMQLSTKWQQNITYQEAVIIARQCAEFFRLQNIIAVDM